MERIGLKQLKTLLQVILHFKMTSLGFSTSFLQHMSSLNEIHSVFVSGGENS